MTGRPSPQRARCTSDPLHAARARPMSTRPPLRFTVDVQPISGVHIRHSRTLVVRCGMHSWASEPYLQGRIGWHAACLICHRWPPEWDGVEPTVLGSQVASTGHRMMRCPSFHVRVGTRAPSAIQTTRRTRASCIGRVRKFLTERSTPRNRSGDLSRLASDDVMHGANLRRRGHACRLERGEEHGAESVELLLGLPHVYDEPPVCVWSGDVIHPAIRCTDPLAFKGSPDIKVGRSPGRSDQELCDLGRNRLIHGFYWDLPEQYFLASVDGRLRRPRSGWGACSAAAKSRRKVFNLWLLLDDRWAGDTAQVEPVR